MIDYRTGNDLDIDAVIELYDDSTLGLRRPTEDRDRMAAMIDGANLTITAWDGDTLVGIARSLTDFSWSTYLADLAVRRSHQKQGIGKELIRRTQEASSPATVILLAAPAAMEYYPRIGMESHPSAWYLKPEDSLR